MYYDYSYAMEEAMGSAVVSLISGIPSSLISIATYVFTALALYTIAQRRGIDRPWLSWIPVANVWILGSISDQYHYVVKGENKSKRKVLLWLNIISAALVAVFFILFAVMIGGVVSNVIMGMDEEEMLESLFGSLAGMMGLMLPLMGVSIATAIIRYMAMYDIYASCDPNNKTVYLVVSILFGITEPIFLFICRNKDGGMPPRREIPAAQSQYSNQQQNQYSSQYRNQYGNQYQNQYGSQYQNQYGNQYQNQYSGQYQNQYGGQYQSPYGSHPDPYANQQPEKDTREQ